MTLEMLAWVGKLAMVRLLSLSASTQGAPDRRLGGHAASCSRVRLGFSWTTSLGLIPHRWSTQQDEFVDLLMRVRTHHPSRRSAHKVHQV
mmetsp:Transcript_9898/g.27709  ORF Transcript_9898/g.27709 Transcript_9898/m.27709 type:complete len:90 (+) Transcript_9898:125-394(+)